MVDVRCQFDGSCAEYTLGSDAGRQVASSVFAANQYTLPGQERHAAEHLRLQPDLQARQILPRCG